MVYLCVFKITTMNLASRLLINIPLLFLITGIMMILSGCKKTNDDPPAVPTPLMTLDFTDDFVNPKLGAIVFISDMQGNLLADTGFTGNKKIVLFQVKGTQLPLSFMVTIARWEPDMHNFTITLQSWMYITPAEWRLKGNRRDTTGQITINLVNVPVHNGPVLYANRGFSNLTFSTTARINSLYETPDDLYVRVNTQNGPFYVWQNGVIPGGVYTVDMSTAVIAETKTIGFPGPAEYYEAVLSGYRQTDYETTLSTQADEILGDGLPAANVTLSYPPDVYEGFQTQLKYIENWSSNTTWQYQVTGLIPEVFKKTNASVLSAISFDQPPELLLETSGNFTVANANWQFNAYNSQNFSWTLSGPDTVTVMKLPKLPPSMVKMFPVLSLDSLVLSHIELNEYYRYPSYLSFVSACFNPSAPLKPENMEVSSITVQYNLKKSAK